MKKSSNTQNRVHFIGICGTAMGATAVAMKEAGWHVTGSDEHPYPPLSDFLAERDIPIAKGYAAENLPKEEALIVVGNAISRGNPELEDLLNRRLPYTSLPEVLHNHFLQGKHNLLVTGTHGKTTTTSLLAFIFAHAGKDPSYLIGGIPHNLGQGAHFSPNSSTVILEGDEYDTAFFDKRSKFLHYLPELVIINNIEFDHADIFENLQAILKSFRQLIHLIPSEGMLLLNADDPHTPELALETFSSLLTVGFAPEATHRITDYRQEEGKLHFWLLGHQFELPMVGVFNARNAAMAISAAHCYGIPLPTIAEALRQFQGVRRRQELLGIAGGVRIIDDFGHHPTAITAILRSLRALYPEGKLWALFEPRSNTTRRNIFQEELTTALGHADGIGIGGVARCEELSDKERLDPEKLVRELKELPHGQKEAFYTPKIEQLLEQIVPRLQPHDTVVILSNGSFQGAGQKLLSALQDTHAPTSTKSCSN